LLCILGFACARADVAQSSKWNQHARQFIWPPTIAIPPVSDAREYRFHVISDDGKTRSLVAREPSVSLAAVWDDLPVDTTTVKADAVLGDGRTVAVEGTERTFHRAAPF